MKPARELPARNLQLADIFQDNMLYEDRIIINDFDDLLVYNFTINQSRLKDVMRKSIEMDKECDDPTIKAFYQVTGGDDTGMLYKISDWSSKSYVAKLRMVNAGYSLAINESGGWMLISKDASITYKKKVYTEGDIKLTKFQGGKHFYAFVNRIEVTDDEGNNHWNTADEAHRQAMKFINKLNSQQL